MFALFLAKLNWRHEQVTRWHVGAIYNEMDVNVVIGRMAKHLLHVRECRYEAVLMRVAVDDCGNYIKCHPSDTEEF